MFEQSTNDVLCGIFKENGEYTPIYCNPVTGECYFPDPVMSYNRLISELSVEEPIECDITDLFDSMESGVYGNCLGVIYAGEHILKLLDDEHAVRVPVDSPDSVGSEEFEINIYGDYDEE